MIDGQSKSEDKPLQEFLLKLRCIMHGISYCCFYRKTLCLFLKRTSHKIIKSHKTQKAKKEETAWF